MPSTKHTPNICSNVDSNSWDHAHRVTKILMRRLHTGNRINEVSVYENYYGRILKQPWIFVNRAELFAKRKKS